MGKKQDLRDVEAIAKRCGMDEETRRDYGRGEGEPEQAVGQCLPSGVFLPLSPGWERGPGGEGKGGEA